MKLVRAPTIMLSNSASNASVLTSVYVSILWHTTGAVARFDGPPWCGAVTIPRAVVGDS